MSDLTASDIANLVPPPSEARNPRAEELGEEPLYDSGRHYRTQRDAYVAWKAKSA